MEKLTIIVAEQKTGERNPMAAMRINAWLGERHLGLFKTPFFSAARILKDEGVDPNTPLAMRWKGKDFDALISTVGRAAALAVNHPSGLPGSTPRLIPYVPVEMAD